MPSGQRDRITVATAFIPSRDQRLSSNISSATSGTDRSKMQRCFGVFCVSLILCATLSETIGMVIAAKERRGWTLNSAGYLLGPHGIDGHRTLGDKAGLAGKRDMGQEEDIRTGPLQIRDEDIIHTVIDFLSYLKLKEMGALDSLPSPATSDELANP
ncbi:hypothetical protein CRENBAI_014319 [Crenichthys baileyi]|uniref:Galanin peptides n=1 Tax=Crenichthys baileyi TaxID=28760 RepID=A0AAV9SBH2_9TELE